MLSPRGSRRQTCGKATLVATQGRSYGLSLALRRADAAPLMRRLTSGFAEWFGAFEKLGLQRRTRDEPGLVPRLGLEFDHRNDGTLEESCLSVEAPPPPCHPWDMHNLGLQTRGGMRR